MEAREAIEYLERYSYDTETMMEVIEVLRAEVELFADLKCGLCAACFTDLHLLEQDAARTPTNQGKESE